MISALLLCDPTVIQANPPEAAATSAAEVQAEPVKHFDIQFFEVHGNGHLLTQLEFERAVYPYLGPYRTKDDVEQARAALEKAYHDKGYAFVAVQVPAQKADTGVITLQVVKNEVGRLRVHGSRYFAIDEIEREAPSLREGTVPNFSEVTRDVGVLNALPNRQITPALHPGIVPGTVDVDLNVKDSLPLHGSLELNDRRSPNTTALRVNGSIDYDNLWQLGHTLGASFQLAPEDYNQVNVFSGYYLARIPDVTWLSLILQGTDQNSQVNTGAGTGGSDVVGKGQTIGGRAVITLPSETNFYHSVSLGIDYKHNNQDITTQSGSTPLLHTPVTYYPISASYSATWLHKTTGTKKDESKAVGETDLNASITAGLRPISSTQGSFDNAGTYGTGSSGDFAYIRGDLSHTHELPGGFQAYGKVQGQLSDEPLVSNEAFSAGGLGTVRGYLESEVSGDNAFLGSFELRTPSLAGHGADSTDERRFYIFSDWGIVGINKQAEWSQNDPGLQSTHQLASVGAGTRMKVFDHYNGSLDFAVPLDQGEYTPAYNKQLTLGVLTFRLWAEF